MVLNLCYHSVPKASKLRAHTKICVIFFPAHEHTRDAKIPFLKYCILHMHIYKSHKYLLSTQIPLTDTYIIHASKKISLQKEQNIIGALRLLRLSKCFLFNFLPGVTRLSLVSSPSLSVKLCSLRMTGVFP